MTKFDGQLERIGILQRKNEILWRDLEVFDGEEGIVKADHVTAICYPEEKDEFLSHWLSQGFKIHGMWMTSDATEHIALIRGSTPEYPWTDMVGLSVPTILHKNIPIQEALKHRNVLPLDKCVTHNWQHIAFNVHPSVDMKSLVKRLSKHFPFMTEVMTFREDSGAWLSQAFVRPRGYFFYELTQRGSGADGKPFGSFDVEIIDSVYRALYFDLCERRVPGYLNV